MPTDRPTKEKEDVAGNVRVSYILDRPSYLPGDTVTGRVCVSMRKECDIVAIRFKIIGREYTAIDVKNVTKASRKGEDVRFWKLLITLAGQPKRDAMVARIETFQAGEYVFPFAFTLPAALPPTLPLPQERKVDASSLPHHFAPLSRSDLSKVTVTGASTSTSLGDDFGVRYEVKAYCDLASSRSGQATSMVCSRGFVLVRSAVSATVHATPHAATIPNRCALHLPSCGVFSMLFSGCCSCCEDVVHIWTTVNLERTVLAVDRDPLAVLIDVDNTRSKTATVQGARLDLLHRLTTKGQVRERLVARIVMHGNVSPKVSGRLEGRFFGLNQLDLSASTTTVTGASEVSLRVTILTDKGEAEPTGEEPPTILLLASTVDPLNRIPATRPLLQRLPSGVYEEATFSEAAGLQSLGFKNAASLLQSTATEPFSAEASVFSGASP